MGSLRVWKGHDARKGLTHYVYGMERNSPKGIGYLLERTSRMVKLNYSQTFKQHGFDVTPEQWVLLENLYLDDGQTQNDLASGSFKDAPTVSRILNILETKGYLIRESRTGDKRIRQVQLTPKGKELVISMKPMVDVLREQGWDHLSEEDYTTFVRIINTIFDNYAGSGSSK